MSQWNRTERMLFAKLVYYGPALGGKTTNLKVLHRLTDPEGRARLVSVDTSDDRTLFFDLLPFDLGSVLGYKVAIKLYTVPGQVRYDATRRVVLAGADAVVFVADSDPAREADNRSAWDDLHRNMRANRLDPASVPVIVQLNKRDVPDAVEPATMVRRLGVDAVRGIEAVACEGDGVVETFVLACRAMLERIVAMAEPVTRKSLDAGDLTLQMERAFAPLLARAAATPHLPAAPATGSRPLIPDGANLLESAVATGVSLGSELADEHARVSRLAREADALRRLSDVLRGTGASFDRDTVVAAALDAALRTTGACSAALVVMETSGPKATESAGRDLQPLLDNEVAAGVLSCMADADAPATIDDLANEIPRAGRATDGLRALVLVPVEPSPRTVLVAAMPSPDGAADEYDVRFLATLAGHLAVGLDKVRTHAELRRHRDRLEDTVRERTRELRKAFESLKAVDAMKDRFLANVSHEMRSPLTAVLSAAAYLRDYDGSRDQREEMAATILQAGESLRRLLDGLIRVASLEADRDADAGPAPPAEVVAEALRLAGREDGVAVAIDPRVDTLTADTPALARALGNLVDNAFKFSPAGTPVEVRVAPCMLARSGSGVRGISIAVLDRGPGIPDEEVERVFVAFEQGGHPLTSKPGGLGLGLYEARTIARRHGGTLIHLPRAGGGSEFRISLPVETAPAESREARHA
jgi:signal transduction histidine kinase/signal recognition particle receptor subunit beta